ncbi:MAG TPA: hypothetical protein VIM01_01785 [Dermatophilaceae bacterium]
MSATQHRIIGLPGGATVTILRLPEALTADGLRAMVAAQLYVLAGATTSIDGDETGYGGYVGTSAALNARTARVGVSLHHWTVRNRRLDPDTVILINNATPLDEPVRLLIEASIARALSPKYSILNIRCSAPTAATLATRHQRLYALHASTRLTTLILDTVFQHHPPAAQGGTTHEQLVRLILNQQPARAMDVADLLTAARKAGISIAGASPAQRTRRDTTTREHQGGTGRPRLLRTHINGRAVIYGAGAMTLRQARADYAPTHPTTPGRSRTPAAGPTHARSAANLADVK